MFTKMYYCLQVAFVTFLIELTKFRRPLETFIANGYIKMHAGEDDDYYDDYYFYY